MPTSTYRELVDRLFPRLSGGIRWGLDRTEQLLNKAGNPQRRFSSIHVGGTNGKGSVAATIARILEQAGQRTGLYTSPHLCSFRERIRVNGRPIDEQELLLVASTLWPELEQSGASFFEATTVLAFQVLARAQVDVAVVEVGLGGRLDSTNVIVPDLSIITNIAFDHAEYLGHTLTAIAGEKAGIIKAGVPVVTADSTPEVIEVFQRRCAAVGAPLHRVQPAVSTTMTLAGSRVVLDTTNWGRIEVTSPLIGEHQARNTALAVAAIDLLAERHHVTRSAVVDGVASVHWPGRFQVERAERTWIFDVAHNEAGVHALVQTFRLFKWPRPIVLLVGILGDKEWARMLPPLFGLADCVLLTVPPTAPASRAWDPERVLREVTAEGVQVERDFVRALQRATEFSKPSGTVLVTGSFHTVGDALAWLGWSEVEPDFPLQRNGFHG